MKKTIYTFSGLIISFLLLILSCTKQENSRALGVGYGGGNNTATTTGPATVTPVSYGEINVNGNVQNVNIVNCSVNNPGSTFQTMGLTAGGRSIIILFNSEPVPGSYNITTSTPGNNQAKVTYALNSINFYGQSGIVTVSKHNNQFKTSISNVSCVGSGSSVTVGAIIQCQ